MKYPAVSASRKGCACPTAAANPLLAAAAWLPVTVRLEWLTSAAACVAAPGASAFRHGQHSDAKRHGGVEPPDAEQRVGEKAPRGLSRRDRRRSGSVFPRRRSRVTELPPELELGAPEPGADAERSDGEADAEPGGGGGASVAALLLKGAEVSSGPSGLGCCEWREIW